MIWPVDDDRMKKGLYWQEALKLVEGCTHASPGCDNCWSAAETYMRAAQTNPKISAPKKGLVEGGRFNGKIRLREDNLDKPLRGRKLRVYAIWNDLFHKDVPDSFIRKVFNVIADTDHTYIILTKRAKRMKRIVTDLTYNKFYGRLDNLILGVTAENQEQADARIPLLLETPASKRFVSIEPMLEPVDLNKRELLCKTWRRGLTIGTYLDWVVLGGESGRNARPMHPDWVRLIFDQCADADVPFFFKQWGEWVDVEHLPVPYKGRVAIAKIEDTPFWRVGKKKAGAMLDGKEYKEVPA